MQGLPLRACKKNDHIDPQILRKTGRDKGLVGRLRLESKSALTLARRLGDKGLNCERKANQVTESESV